jgi:hypothetical protein
MVLGSCATAQHGDVNATPRPAACPTHVTAALPPSAPDRLVLRVQRIFAHRAMASVVAAFFDDASERALLLRAERYGFDARTLDRAAIAWTPRGSTLYVAAGPLDGAAIARRLWERLIGQRRRSEDRARNERLEGELSGRAVSLLVRPACGVVAYQEGVEGRLVDRVMASELPSTSDPDATIWWRTTRRFEQAPPEGAALMRSVRAIEVRGEPGDRGLEVDLRFEGALPPDAERTLRRVADSLIETPLGGLSGAVQWAAPSRLRITREAGGGVRVQAVVPWGALEALAGGLAGRV